jgi:DNA-binding winged helix-turn-helix (wHTH) protein/Flp pilus assembly protein TadD
MPRRQILTRKSRVQELDLAVAWWSILSKTSSVPHYSFGDIEVDAESRRLTKAGELLPVPDRHFGVLLELLACRGSIVSKDALIEAVWQDVAVTDNSLEQAVSALRRTLGTGPDGQPYIQTVPRQGYRFVGTVTQVAARATDSELEELLAPHRAWVEGRAALETLERDQIVRARHVFASVLERAVDHAPAHVGLANACIMQFEMTRADERPDVAALEAAARHSREACRLARDYGEAWATLGIVLDRTGRHVDALAASRRAVTLEPDNWRHHFRLAYVGWGEERLRAAHRTLSLLPGFALAHWLIATVHVARQALGEAERELAAGLASQSEQLSGRSRFSAVALHWLRGLIYLARNESEAALAAFERELAFEHSGHLYGRECCANTWYAIGALQLRRGDRDAAVSAFREALTRVAVHPLARLGLGALDVLTSPAKIPSATTPPVDAAIGSAIGHALAGRHIEAAALVNETLASAPPGNAGWLLPVEPLLHVTAHPEVWAPALARVQTRAA